MASLLPLEVLPRIPRFSAPCGNPCFAVQPLEAHTLQRSLAFIGEFPRGNPNLSVRTGGYAVTYPSRASAAFAAPFREGKATVHHPFARSTISYGLVHYFSKALVLRPFARLRFSQCDPPWCSRFREMPRNKAIQRKFNKIHALARLVTSRNHSGFRQNSSSAPIFAPALPRCPMPPPLERPRPPMPRAGPWRASQRPRWRHPPQWPQRPSQGAGEASRRRGACAFPTAHARLYRARVRFSIAGNTVSFLTLHRFSLLRGFSVFPGTVCILTLCEF